MCDYIVDSVSSKLLSGLYNQRRTGKFCDVKICINDTNLWVHSCVVSIFSTTFYNLFLSNEKLTTNTKRKCTNKIYNNLSLNNPLEINLNDELKIEENCIECIDKVLDFLYTGKIHILNELIHVTHIENYSKLFNLNDLSALCLNIKLKLSEITPVINDEEIIISNENEIITTNNTAPLLKNLEDKNINNKNSGRYTCLCCGTCHRSSTSLVKHLKDTINDKEVLRCSLCLKYEAPNKETLLSHIELHDNELPFFCLACDARFRTRTALSSHEPRHSTETPFLCNLCGKGFKWKHALTNHNLIHSAEKRHLCDTCGFSTAHMSTFRTHKMVHAGVCFKCPQPNCTFVATRKQSLHHHVATHSKERHYQCEICGQSFSMYKNLRRHATRHEVSPAGLMCCPVPGCLYSNTRLDKIKAHAERHKLGKPVRSLLIPRVQRHNNSSSTTTTTQVIQNNLIEPVTNTDNDNIVIILPPAPEGTVFTIT